MAAATYSNVLSQSFSERTSLVLKSPSTTTTAQLLVAVVFVFDPSSITVEGPTGWAKAGQLKGTDRLIAVFTKAASEAGEKSYEFKWGGGLESCAGFMATVGEFNVSSPVAAFEQKSVTTASTSMPFSSVAGVKGGLSMLISGATGASTPPTGYTERLDVVAAYLATAELPTTGATEEKTATGPDAETWVTAHLVIAPKEEAVAVQPKLAMVI